MRRVHSDAKLTAVVFRGNGNHKMAASASRLKEIGQFGRGKHREIKKSLQDVGKERNRRQAAKR